VRRTDCPPLRQSPIVAEAYRAHQLTPG